MLRPAAILTFVLVLLLCSLVFEFQNVWPFNQGRFPMLRLLFSIGLAATAATFAVSPQRWAPPLLLAASFASTSALSAAAIGTGYCAVVMAAVVIVALCSAVARPILGTGRRH
jgi:hypothetical protein